MRRRPVRGGEEAPYVITAGRLRRLFFSAFVAVRSGSHFGQTTGRFVVGAFAEHFSMSAIENDTATSRLLSELAGAQTL